MQVKKKSKNDGKNTKAEQGFYTHLLWTEIIVVGAMLHIL